MAKKETVEKTVQNIRQKNAQEVFCGGQDPDRPGRTAWRDYHHRTVSARRDQQQPVLPLEQRVPGGGQAAPGW